jgi:hypothetical protein
LWIEVKAMVRIAPNPFLFPSSNDVPELFKTGSAAAGREDSPWSDFNGQPLALRTSSHKWICTRGDREGIGGTWRIRVHLHSVASRPPGGASETVDRALS